jgi:hypothetical protein
VFIFNSSYLFSLTLTHSSMEANVLLTPTSILDLHQSCMWYYQSFLLSLIDSLSLAFRAPYLFIFLLFSFVTSPLSPLLVLPYLIQLFILVCLGAWFYRYWNRYYIVLIPSKSWLSIVHRSVCYGTGLLQKEIALIKGWPSRRQEAKSTLSPWLVRSESIYGKEEERSCLLIG